MMIMIINCSTQITLHKNTSCNSLREVFVYIFICVPFLIIFDFIKWVKLVNNIKYYLDNRKFSKIFHV